MSKQRPRVAITTTTDTLAGSAFAASETVEIATTSGRTFVSEPVVFAKGSHQRPLSQDDLRGKFLDCLGDILPADIANETFDKLMALERLSGTADLLSFNKSAASRAHARQYRRG